MSTQANRVLLADRQREAGVVEDRPPILLRVHDRLDVDQARSAIDRQPKLAREWPDRDVADGDRRAAGPGWPRERVSGRAWLRYV